MDFFEQLDRALDTRHKNMDVDFDRMKDDWRTLFFGSVQGKRVLGDMLALCDYFGTAFTGNSRTYFLEGQRYFVSLIIRFAGLDTAEGLHQLLVVRAAAEQRRGKEPHND